MEHFIPLAYQGKASFITFNEGALEAAVSTHRPDRVREIMFANLWCPLAQKFIQMDDESVMALISESLGLELSKS